jgi:hypothetical protein
MSGFPDIRHSIRRSVEEFGKSGRLREGGDIRVIAVGDHSVRVGIGFGIPTGICGVLTG